MTNTASNIRKSVGPLFAFARHAVAWFVRIARASAWLAFTFAISACNTGRQGLTGDVLNIDNIHIDAASKHNDGSVEMITRCSGFVLSETEVNGFLKYASRFKDDGQTKYYKLLPCSASGNVRINGKKYDWLIRAGGIGEIRSGTERYNMVCGKQCCKKVPGVC